MNELQKLESWRRDLALANTIEEIKIHEDAAAAMAQLAKRQQIGLDKQNEIGRYRTDVETKKGEWLKEHFPPGGDHGNQYTVARSHQGDLATMPTTKRESARARKIAKIAKENNELLESIQQKIEDSGDVITPQKVYKDIKKEERQQEIEQQKEEIKNIQPVEGKYDILVVDPPWPYGRKYDPQGSRVANPYPEMSIEQIKDIKMPMNDNCIIFLWTTHKFLPHSFDILKKWGFEYKATMVWNKEKIGMGHWLRMQCEFCLLGIAGSPIWDIKDWRDIITESRKEHSRKPALFFEAIDKYFPYYSKLEYFSREQREGWESYGNDLNKFNA